MRLSTLLLACACFMVALSMNARPSVASPVYRVVIASKPAGASVWIGERSGEPAGTTPYEARLPEGKHTIFLELAGHEFAVQDITVQKRKKGVQRAVFELTELSYGTVDVVAAGGASAADGARVLIDGKDVGTVPDSFEVTEGAHQLEVVKPGFQRFEKWIEVARGQSLEISVRLEPERPGQSEPSTAPEPGPVISGSAPRGRSTDPYLVLSAGLGSGWRSFGFTYADPDTQVGIIRDYSAVPIPLMHVRAELPFGALVSSLRWLSLFGGASLSLRHRSVDTDGNGNIDTSWLRREVGVRSRVAMGSLSLALDVAEGGNSFTFDEADLAAVNILPEEVAAATYEYVRVGATVAMVKGANDFGAGGDGLIVFGNQGVADRFVKASIYGLRAHGWYRRRIIPSVDVSLTGSLTRFSHTLEPPDPTLPYWPTGGTDLMIDVVLAAAYRL